MKVIAESVGLGGLSDEVALAMASDVEYRLREVAQEALKFMRHGKRTRLTTADVNQALRLRNVEQLYGFSSSAPLRFHKAAGTKDLFFVEDKELTFQELMDAPLPKCPREPTLAAHWLAIEGVQPAIRQNPSEEEASEILGYSRVSLSGKRKRALHPNADASSSSFVDGSSSTPTDGSVSSDSSPKQKPTVQEYLSKELQVYYQRITSALLGPSVDLAEKAVASLQFDVGLQPLLPYFARFLEDEIADNLRDLERLWPLLKSLRALLANDSLHIDPHLHHFLPALCTCIVGEHLGRETEDHWSLRNYATEVVADLCVKFADTYETLQPRVSMTLLRAFLDPSKSFATNYGGIVGLTKLGVYVIKLMILPNIGVYYDELLQPILAPESADEAMDERTDGDDMPSSSSSSSSDSTGAQRVYSALLEAVGVYLRAEAEHCKLLLSRKREGGARDAEGDQEDSEERRHATIRGENPAQAQVKQDDVEESDDESDSEDDPFGELCSGELWQVLSRVFGESLQQFLQPQTIAPAVLMDSLI
eukprot:CAMPEP_0177681514 /NCGR_PEP_ID=MMETSP0447-20121125/30761_1 /TAXON_ID=0 /ORGANISM="Stygamoeba regulata, Strain BSH-02190019" /LENGTH=534 /DNA_ID=CAMNT_0019190945 /DNA_START=109 /DNA_END=1713 /DNA_ORIENTATION=+